MTQDCIILAREGTPVVILAAEYFKDEIRLLAKARGMPDLPRLIFPGRFEELPGEELKSQVREITPKVASILTAPAEVKE